MKRRIRLVIDSPDGARDLIVAGDPESGACQVELGGEVSRVEVTPLPDGRLSLLFESGRQLCGRAAAVSGGVAISTARGSERVALSDPRLHRPSVNEASADTGRAEVRALMPGRVLEILVREGETVAAGAVLLVLEAMKMQNEIRAPRESRVVQIAVAAKQAVEGGALMLVLDDPERSAA